MMRAAINIYEHPDVAASDIWTKGDSTQAASEVSVGTIFRALGALSVAAAASTYAVFRYTSLGQILKASVIAQKMGW